MAQEVDQPDDHTVGATATVPAQQLKEDILSSGTNDSSSPVVINIAEVTNHSGESAYIARDYGCTGQYGVGALSSEEEDGGAVSDEGCSFHLPDAILGPGLVHNVTEEEVQLGNWTSWFWNE